MSAETKSLVVMEDSPEAASYRTDIRGWVSRTGLYCGDGPDSERCARYDGSTHKKCEKCSAVISRNSWCSACHDKADKEAYLKMPKKKWDGVGGLCVDGDRYFWSIEEAEDYAEELGIKFEDLPLVICEPQYAPEIDPDELFLDLLPEDQGLHEVYPELYQAIEKVNELIRLKKKPLSWWAGKFRFDFGDRP
ncbi:MAG TPA: hypothetical protein VHE12_05895 [bacterium]|nr:hypothetical protein [bacterium]